MICTTHTQTHNISSDFETIRKQVRKFQSNIFIKIDTSGVEVFSRIMTITAILSLLKETLELLSHIICLQVGIIGSSKILLFAKNFKPLCMSDQYSSSSILA